MGKCESMFFTRKIRKPIVKQKEFNKSFADLNAVKKIYEKDCSWRYLLVNEYNQPIALCDDFENAKLQCQNNLYHNLHIVDLAFVEWENE